jgi:TonB family protein
MKIRLFLVLLHLAVVFDSYSQMPDFDEEQIEYLHEVGKLTASQTWWFFEHRLKEPLPEYRFHHVYLPFQDVWVKDIKPLPKGRFVGVIDLDLPHGKGVEMLKDSIRFQPGDVGDWIIVDDYYLLGGFTLWYRSFTELKPYRKLGQFRMKGFCVNRDFVELSELKEETSKDAYQRNGLLLQQHFIGGAKTFYDSIHAKTEYPDYAVLIGIEGYVTLRFKLNGDGELEDFAILRGIGCGLHEEFIVAVKSLEHLFVPDPDKKDVYITIPFHFRLIGGPND